MSDIEDMVKSDIELYKEFYQNVRSFMIDADYNKHYKTVSTACLYDKAERYAINILQNKYDIKKGDIYD